MSDNEISVKDWLITLIVSFLPFIGFIMLFVWAFSGGTPASKANWAKAMLLWYAIVIVLAILFWSTIAALFIGAAAVGG